MEKEINSPKAGTCGRLFDAVSAFLHICTRSTYDGEAAIRLAELVDEDERYEPYLFAINENNLLEIDLRAMWLSIHEDVKRNESVKTIVGRFHQTVVSASVQMIRKAIEKNPEFNREVVLSGGSMHNRYIVKHLIQDLGKLGFKIFTHQKVPCNDGG